MCYNEGIVVIVHLQDRREKGVTIMSKLSRRAKKVSKDTTPVVVSASDKTQPLSFFKKRDDTKKDDSTPTQVASPTGTQNDPDSTSISSQPTNQPIVPTTAVVPVASTTPVSSGVTGAMNGPAMAFSCWDWKNGLYYLLTDLWSARQISNGDYVPVWVWLDNGHIDHVLSSEEIRKYRPGEG